MTSTLIASQTLLAKYGASTGWDAVYPSPKPRRISITFTPAAAGFIKVEALVFAAREFVFDVPELL